MALKYICKSNHLGSASAELISKIPPWWLKVLEQPGCDSHVQKRQIKPHQLGGFVDLRRIFCWFFLPVVWIGGCFHQCPIEKPCFFHLTLDFFVGGFNCQMGSYFWQNGRGVKILSQKQSWKCFSIPFQVPAISNWICLRCLEKS